MNNLKTFKQFLNEGNYDGFQFKTGDLVMDDHLKTKFEVIDIARLKDALAIIGESTKLTQYLQTYKKTDMFYCLKTIKPGKYGPDDEVFKPGDMLLISIQNDDSMISLDHA